MWITSSLTTTLTPTAIALGNFDGLHRGHRQVIKPIFNLKGRSKLLSVYPSELAISSEVDEGTKVKLWPQNFKLSSWDSENELGKDDDYQRQKIYSTVVTFNPHPQEFFSGKLKKLLTPLEEKLALLKLIGVEQVVLLPFNQELANLTPTEFCRRNFSQTLTSTSNKCRI